MTRYVYGTGLSYADYLQARSFQFSIQSGIAQQVEKVIGSQTELHAASLDAVDQLLENVTDALTVQTTQTLEGFAQLNQSLTEVRATLQWGFGEVLGTLSLMQESFETLLDIAKSPVQTWAYEQYEIARDAYRRNLNAEALVYLDRAINGYGSQPGYLLDYRFHLLKGTILLGSPRLKDTDIVDLGAAARAFLDAARYAESESSEQAAKALLGAGWAAYANGRVGAAEEYTRRSIDLHRDDLDAHYQLAKICFHTGSTNAGTDILRVAIEGDHKYAAEVVTDGDFMSHQTDVFKVIQEVRDLRQTECMQLLARLEEKGDQLASLQIGRQKYIDYGDEALDEVGELLDEAAELLKQGTLFAGCKALEELRVARKALCAAEQNFLERAIQVQEEEIEAAKLDKSHLRQKIRNRQEGTAAVFLVIGALCALPFGVRSCISIVDGASGWEANGLLDGLEKFVLSLLELFIAAPLVMILIPALVGGVAAGLGWLVASWQPLELVSIQRKRDAAEGDLKELKEALRVFVDESGAD